MARSNKENRLSLSGYDTEDRFYATRYAQGARRVYSLDLSLAQVASYLPAPDPTRPTEGNRRVREGHAAAFGRYVHEQEGWVSPALLLRGPDIFKFEVKEEIAGTEFGILSVPRLARADIKTLDGQHRILGIHLELARIARELEKKRELLARGKKNGETAPVLQELQEQIRALEDVRARFGRERISIQLVIEDDPTAFRQMFVDIADNALGITSSVRTRFDSRKVANRCVEPVIKHDLLADRVDLEQDRIGAANPNFIGAKHVAELIRTLEVGIDGRIGRRLEDELREDALVEQATHFLDTITESFPPLGKVADGELAPEELRKTSVLGSASMLRVLAGVHYQLARQNDWEEEDIAEFFSALAPHLGAPVSADSIWVKHVPGEIFSEGALAPKARRQDLKSLVDTITSWALKQPAWLTRAKAAA